MFKTYDSEIKKLLSDRNSKTNWKNIFENHKSMIAKIQHERLIHLLVTIFVGAVMCSSAFITIVTKEQGLLIFFVPTTLLFIGYIFHYRFLENTTQNWYLLEEEIKKALV
jgi:hypothetical protein